MRQNEVMEVIRTKTKCSEKVDFLSQQRGEGGREKVEKRKFGGKFGELQSVVLHTHMEEDEPDTPGHSDIGQVMVVVQHQDGHHGGHSAGSHHKGHINCCKRTNISYTDLTLISFFQVQCFVVKGKYM